MFRVPSFLDFPVPEHMLPYELQLGRSPSLEDLLNWVLEKRLRPTIPHQWARVSQVHDI